MLLFGVLVRCSCAMLLNHGSASVRSLHCFEGCENRVVQTEQTVSCEFSLEELTTSLQLPLFIAEF